MNKRIRAFHHLKAAQFVLLLLIYLGFPSHASATLTSNSQSKSDMPDDVEQQVSVQSATAILSVAELVRAVEVRDSLDVNFESLDNAINAVDSLIQLLQDNLENTSEDVLFLDEIVPSHQGIADPEDVDRSKQAQEWATNYVRAGIDGEVSDRALVNFLLVYAQQAQSALNLARVAAENQDPDLLRLAILRFDTFTYATISYSVVWSLAVTQ